MYELVKKKSWAIRIISGFRIFFVTAQVLRLMSREPNLNDLLHPKLRLMQPAPKYIWNILYKSLLFDAEIKKQKNGI